MSKIIKLLLIVLVLIVLTFITYKIFNTGSSTKPSGPKPPGPKPPGPKPPGPTPPGPTPPGPTPPGPTPPGPVQNLIKAYLNNVYPTSDTIQGMNNTDAENFYKNLWFYFLVSDIIGTASNTTTKSGKSIKIPGTLSSIDNLMPVEYNDGAVFFHPNSIAIKNPSKVFYNDAGKQGNDPKKALEAVSNGNYIEISSFGWNSYPNGIYLNSAKGSGIFWNPGKIAVNYNKLAIIYMISCQLKNVSFQNGKFTTDGYNAMIDVLKIYDQHSSVMRLLNKIKGVSSAHFQDVKDVVKAHVEDNREILSISAIVTDEAVSTYDNPMRIIGMKAGYDSAMMIAQANADGSFDIEFCDFRVVLNGSFGSGSINDDFLSKWNLFSSKYLSIRDPFDITNESKTKQLDILFPNIMFSGDDTKYCKANYNCGPVITEGYSNSNVNKSCKLLGCRLADKPGSWKNGQTIQIYGTKPIDIFTPGGIMWAINNTKNGLSMNNKALTTSKILESLSDNSLVPKLSSTEINILNTTTDLNTYLKTLNISTPKDLTTGIKNYLKITYPLSSKFWDMLEHNDLVNIYLQINSHYMPLLLPIGKMTIPKCTIPNECVLPPSVNSRTQFWAFDGIHIEGAAGSSIGKEANSTKNYPNSSPYAYQTVGNPFDGGPHATFDNKTMTFSEGGYPNYAWVESVQYADEAGGKRLLGKWTGNNALGGPESCDCVNKNDCSTFVKTPDVVENFSGDIPCDESCKTQYKPCAIGQECSGQGCNSYCGNPDAYSSCAITYEGNTPPSSNICGYLDMDNEKWIQTKCSDKDACKWALASSIDKNQSEQQLFSCINNPTDKNSCAIPWTVNNKSPAKTINIPVTNTMYYPQQGYGRFTNYGKTGIYYSNVSLLLTIPDLNLRMSMEQIIQLVGNAVGGLSIQHQFAALLGKDYRHNKDPRKFLMGYVVLPNKEYNNIPSADKSKIYKINNKRNVNCENPLINPKDDPRLQSIAQNFTALYIPPEANISNPNYNKKISYDYDTAIELLMAMYIHGCTGNHGQNQNYPFGSYNSYGMVIGHLAYVRTKAMGWNTVQLARDPDYSGNSMKYCEWPFYDYEIIHVAADPPAWFKPSMANKPNPKYPNETDGYGFDLSVGGVWADSGAHTKKPYIFCKGMFTLDITKYFSFYAVHKYLPGTGNWNKDVELYNPQYINRNIFRQGQLLSDKYATAVRPYFTPTTWNADPILYDQTCPFPEWKGNTCSPNDKNCVPTQKGQGIYYQAMHSTTPTYSWPLGKKNKY